MLLLLAQITDLSGETGWVGAGLLGLVLSWLLLVHLPAKDKQLQMYIEMKDAQHLELLSLKDQQLLTKDKQIQSLIEQNWANLEAMQIKFSESLRHVTAHCEREIEKIVKRHEPQS